MRSTASTAFFLATAILSAGAAHDPLKNLQRRLQDEGATETTSASEVVDAAWTYRLNGEAGVEPYGPADWHLGYPDCGLSRQTPINLSADLSTVATAAQEPLTLSQNLCDSSELTFLADDAVYKVNFDQCSAVPSVNFDGATWNLLQIHIHSPSEHLFGGAEYPAEVHFVHLKDGTDGELLVIGVMFETEDFAENKGLVDVWNVLNTGAETTTEMFTVAVYDLLPVSKSFSHYMGSLTTPPCTQGVTWIVMDQPNVMSTKQLAAFRDSVAHAPGSKVSETGATNRPVQPLNGRPLLFVTA